MSMGKKKIVPVPGRTEGHWAATTVGRVPASSPCPFPLHIPCGSPPAAEPRLFLYLRLELPMATIQHLPGLGVYWWNPFRSPRSAVQTLNSFLIKEVSNESLIFAMKLIGSWARGEGLALAPLGSQARDTGCLLRHILFPSYPVFPKITQPSSNSWLLTKL